MFQAYLMSRVRCHHVPCSGDRPDVQFQDIIVITLKDHMVTMVCCHKAIIWNAPLALGRVKEPLLILLRLIFMKLAKIFFVLFFSLKHHCVPAHTAGPPRMPLWSDFT